MQGITKEKFTEYIKVFDFQNLFIDLGWDYEDSAGNIVVAEKIYNFRVVAKLHGFNIIVISSNEQGIPDRSLRQQVSTGLSRTFPENLLIFHGERTQFWSYRIQAESGKEKYTETVFYTDKESDALFQRASGLFFRLDEYDRITFVDVKSRIRKGFTVNYDTVTKRFYDHFKREHESFKKAIEGITDKTDLDWYTSVTLNRLMFCYFIQKKGFLDNDTDYLQKKLQLFIDREDNTGFYSFYIDFLMVLFHDGLGGRERDDKKRELLGNIPYLNGGMFEVHELEQKYDLIRIHNNAFKEIFDFFDQYKWHLDINPDAPGNEINPDVLGYIFEKYINQRAEMGAYYTKEDITGYIGKNTILPFLFDEVKRKYPEPFKANGEVWQFLENSGDRYIYPAMKFGIPESVLNNPGSDGLFDDLPDAIKTGIDPEQEDLWKIRKPWNKPAPNDIALPTEIYREVIERRGRYKEVKSVITSGSIKGINDLITQNLDIINFTEDLLTNTQDAKLVEHFYKAIEKVTILDPTCGSGAFLFAAMNILEPVYEILIERMRSFVYDEDRINAEKYASRKGGFLFKYPFFREVLGKVSGLKDPGDPESGQNHPNQRYFILKSIILNNLYGVDIMREAVEIAKLRLFLKLVAQVHPNPTEDNMGIEPLPDMDFNLKVGNTLVGFGTKGEIESLSSLLVNDKEREKIYTECDKISRIFESFKEAQLSHGETNLLKKEIKERIEKLNDRLDLLLYTAHYGGGDFTQWLDSHQPFHWFAEFYGIFESDGGFDIVIGNPPYVEYSTKKFNYKVDDSYLTLKCGNLYPFIVERSGKLINERSNYGFIVPISGFCTKRMKPFLDLMLSGDRARYFSHYCWRPATLFEGVNIPLTIILSNHNNDLKSITYSTEFFKWYSDLRKSLFNLVAYTAVDNIMFSQIAIPKANQHVKSVVERMYQQSNRIERLILPHKTNFPIYYRNTGGLYWRIITDFVPYFKQDGVEGKAGTVNAIFFRDLEAQKSSCALFNSNLFWLHYETFSSFHHVCDDDLIRIPFEVTTPEIELRLINISSTLMAHLITESKIQIRAHKGGSTSEIQTFYPLKSKSIVDQLDVLLKQVYNYSEDDLDFIIHFDYKFRVYEEVSET